MIDEADLIHGKQWIHKRQKYGVRVVSFADIKTRDSDDARWQDGIGFVKDSEAGTLYVLPKKGFEEKFEPVAEDVAAEEPQP